MNIFTFHLKGLLGQRFPGRYGWQYRVSQLFLVMPIAALLSLVVQISEPSTWQTQTRNLVLLWLAFGSLTWVLDFCIALTQALVKAYQARGFARIKMSPGYRAFKLNRNDREFLKWCRRSIPSRKEKITASATLSKDGTVWAVMSPGRHHHCIWFMAEHGTNKQIEQQGFLTNRGRFLGRQDARRLAMRNGQCPKPNHDRDLFSEDLWPTPPYLAQKA